LAARKKAANGAGKTSVVKTDRRPSFPATPPARSAKQIERIRQICLAYPETREDHPWGHSAFKVRDKVFVFMGVEETQWTVGMKLKASHKVARAYPFTAPTHYGMGKYGWITCTFSHTDTAPIDVIEDWIREGFLLIAPKKIAQLLDT
jgi:predicted DNA-binding protein (MmcQ/YjbR family)